MRIKGCLVILFVPVILAGWVMNVITLFNWSDPVNGECIVRAIGVFVPFVGGVAGWF